MPPFLQNIGQLAAKFPWQSKLMHVFVNHEGNHSYRGGECAASSSFNLTSASPIAQQWNITLSLTSATSQNLGCSLFPEGSSLSSVSSPGVQTLFPVRLAEVTHFLSTKGKSLSQRWYLAPGCGLIRIDSAHQFYSFSEP